jgi:hypothetical protein
VRKNIAMKEETESMEKMLKEVESMCICEACPTYLGLGRTDDYIAYCFATRGKSKNIKEEAGCICPSCPVYEKMNFTTDYFCTQGTEKQQKQS